MRGTITTPDLKYNFQRVVQTKTKLALWLTSECINHTTEHWNLMDTEVHADSIDVSGVSSQHLSQSEEIIVDSLEFIFYISRHHFPSKPGWPRYPLSRVPVDTLGWKKIVWSLCITEKQFHLYDGWGRVPPRRNPFLAALSVVLGAAAAAHPSCAPSGRVFPLHAARVHCAEDFCGKQRFVSPVLEMLRDYSITEAEVIVL